MVLVLVQVVVCLVVLLLVEGLLVEDFVVLLQVEDLQCRFQIVECVENILEEPDYVLQYLDSCSTRCS